MFYSIKDKIDTDFDNFVRSYSNQPFNIEEWNAYFRIVESLQPNRVMVVRPPVSPEMYAYENEEMSETIQIAEDEFKALDILYIDMNPNHYTSLDQSHIEWFDTDEVTTDLFLAAKSW